MCPTQTQQLAGKWQLKSKAEGKSNLKCVPLVYVLKILHTHSLHKGTGCISIKTACRIRTKKATLNK